MPALNTRDYPYWLDAAIRSGLSSSQSSNPFTSFLQTLGILKPPTSLTLSAFSSASVTNKRVIIVGVDCAGKTTLLKSHISVDSSSGAHRDVTVQVPFIGANIETVVDQRSKNEFHTIDVGACAPTSYYVFNRAVCAQGDAIVWVVDGSDRDQFVESAEELKINLEPSRRHELRLGPVGARIFGSFEGLVAVLVNKRDVENSMTMEEIEKRFRPALEKLGDRKWKIFEVTTRSGKGISEAMKWVAGQLQNHTSALTDEKIRLDDQTVSVEEKDP